MLSLLTARQRGWSAEHGSCLVNAALTMNVVMSELQAVLAEQRDPPSKRQHGQIRAHPHGVQQVTGLTTLLRAADVFMAKISPRAMRAAMAPQLAAHQLFQQDRGAPLATQQRSPP